MSQVIISDTTTLIVLEKQNKLSLLCKLFDEVIVPQAVYEELLIGLESDKTVKAFSCLNIEIVVYSERLQDLLMILDQGEAEAIELAISKNLPLIIDEKKGRKIAQNLGLIVTGLAGILILATKKKILTSNQAQVLLEKSMQSGYRLSEALYKQIVDRLAVL